MLPKQRSDGNCQQSVRLLPARYLIGNREYELVIWLKGLQHLTM